jgi:hypothetical protein
MANDLKNFDSRIEYGPVQELSPTKELILWRELAVDTFCVDRGTECDYLLREAVYHGWEAALEFVSRARLSNDAKNQK